MILLSAATRKLTVQHVGETFEECRLLAEKRGMGFEARKCEWIGFGRGEWPSVEAGGEVIRPVGEIRVLGYRFNKEPNDNANGQYWVDCGFGVRKRIGALGRRFGSGGGIGAYECWRLIQGAFLATVYYGLEMLDGEEKALNCIQVGINDTIRSLFRMPLKTATKCILSEFGCVPVNIEHRYRKRVALRRALKYRYGEEYPWFNHCWEKWKLGDYEPLNNDANGRVLNLRPNIIVGKNKEDGMRIHNEMVEEMSVVNGMTWAYSDASKSGIRGSLGWAWATGDGMTVESGGCGGVDGLCIMTYELAAIEHVLRERSLKGMKEIVIFSDCRPGEMLLGKIGMNGDEDCLTNAMAVALNEYDKVTVVWVPGHRGIAGNHQADREAKRNMGKGVDYGRWADWRLVRMDKGEDLREMRKKETLEWSRKNGHDYNDRKPRKPAHLKGLSRMEYYCLYRIRTGSDKNGHESHDGYEDRFHLTECNKFDRGVKPTCNDPTIGSYNHYHLSPNGIPRGIQRWYGPVYFIQIAGKPRKA